MAYVIIQGRGLSGALGRVGLPTTVVVPKAQLPVFVPPKTGSGFTVLLPPKTDTSTSKGPSGTTIAIGVGVVAVAALVLSRSRS